MKASIKKLIDRNVISVLLSIFWPPMLVYTMHVFFSRGLHLYQLQPWIDIPMHYLGGLSMAYSLFLTLVFLQEHSLITHMDSFIELTLVFSLVITIAVFWEFLEFSKDKLLGTNVQISLKNTMQDLFMGMLGVSTMIVYKIFRKTN
jgi:predicted permease